MQGVLQKGAATLRVIGPAFQCQHCHKLPTNFIYPTSSKQFRRARVGCSLSIIGLTYVNVIVDSMDDLEELPTPGEGQSRRQPEK